MIVPDISRMNPAAFMQISFQNRDSQEYFWLSTPAVAVTTIPIIQTKAVSARFVIDRPKALMYLVIARPNRLCRDMDTIVTIVIQINKLLFTT